MTEKKEKQYITFDLETLGNTSNAPIVQIGAVKFDREGNIKDTFLRNIKLSCLSRYDFDIDYSTLQWWFEQDDEAIKSVFCKEGAIDLRLALREYVEWIGVLGDYTYWSHATFDPPILKNNFNAVKLQYNIPFRVQRDIRTLTHFTGKIDCERQGIHHNALDDCLFQAEYISKGFKKLQNIK